MGASAHVGGTARGIDKQSDGFVNLLRLIGVDNLFGFLSIFGDMPLWNI
jgi:hypothetical protein